MYFIHIFKMIFEHKPFSSCWDLYCRGREFAFRVCDVKFMNWESHKSQPLACVLHSGGVKIKCCVICSTAQTYCTSINSGLYRFVQVGNCLCGTV